METTVITTTETTTAVLKRSKKKNVNIQMLLGIIHIYVCTIYSYTVGG